MRIGVEKCIASQNGQVAGTRVLLTAVQLHASAAEVVDVYVVVELRMNRGGAGLRIHGTTVPPPHIRYRNNLPYINSQVITLYICTYKAFNYIRSIQLSETRRRD